MPKDKKVLIPISPKAFRYLFIFSHWLIPLVGAFFIFGHFYWAWNLSWELMALIGFSILPFLLPLLFVYVGKIGNIEMRGDIFGYDESGPTTADNNANQPASLPPVKPLLAGPHFAALRMYMAMAMQPLIYLNSAVSLWICLVKSFCPPLPMSLGAKITANSFSMPKNESRNRSAVNWWTLRENRY